MARVIQVFQVTSVFLMFRSFDVPELSDGAKAILDELGRDIHPTVHCVGYVDARVARLAPPA